jgi:hypothetical protein
MKTKEFKKGIEELGYSVSDSYVYWHIKDKENHLVAIVHKCVLLKFSTDFAYWQFILDDNKIKVFNLITDFSKTQFYDRDKFTEEQIKLIKEKYSKDLYILEE